MALRDDINSWSQVLHGKSKPIVAEEHKRIWKPPVIMNDWKELSSHRKFFDNFASENGFDPLVPENWYKVERKDIMAKGQSLINGYYNGSFVQALLSVYTEINFDMAKFKLKSKEYWDDIFNRKQFFDEFANKNKFDPLDPNAWYSVSNDQIKAGSFDGSRLLLRYHGSLYKALSDTYPDIGLEKDKFPTLNEWEDIDKCKIFFNNYAKENGFDPKVAENWYSVNFDDIVDQSPGLVFRFNGSIPTALSSVYPRIGINKKRFKLSSSKYWSIKENQKKYFMYIAEQKGFDPNVPENWYNLNSDEFRELGGKFILALHNTSYISAVQFVFPEFNLVPHKFKAVPRNFWAVAKNRKIFWDEYALSKGFEPTDTERWYSVSRDEIVHGKGSGMLYYFEHLADCIIDAYPDIGLKRDRFLLRRRWSDQDNRVEFFKNFAAHLKFDPDVADNWYSISAEDVSKMKGGSQILKHFNGSLPDTLISTFPNLSLDPSRFIVTSKTYWLSSSNHKQFFDNFAKSRAFDPLQANNWFKITKDDIVARTGGKIILKYYGGSLASALMSTYTYTGSNKDLMANFPKEK